ncbi:S-adenosylmethionine-dependent methyltransferase [Pleurotus ostreatus]|uniref:S-adenosylmethionine-dependent methyltransferase n=1 Tax=Pleurotus ostreatus TaxID=5322 RepID=A0A8H7A200_PLEOS|nr:S-adenosylmethionine-dependent methyltransferase [Pleurotus ostreatus]KAF7437157.1 S-adenosylmethionine-dependent methyltransferase [Pleurotus ostreatus]KAJ8703027.1 S-adenosylmethionine-dependent methyltransferase [Pleurotus ostreatus]
MIPTPNLSHLTAKDFERVYEPAEDTFLLLDALENDAEDLKSSRPLICLEIGSGSGCVSAFIGTILGPSSALYLCTDINTHACQCTVATGRQNKVCLESVGTYLDRSLHTRLKHRVDLLIFNPPYVPTDSVEAESAQSSPAIASAWAGGINGMELTNTFLKLAPELLAPQGRFYLVAVKENNIPRILAAMLNEHDLAGKVVLQRRAGREHLHILRFEKQGSQVQT